MRRMTMAAFQSSANDVLPNLLPGFTALDLLDETNTISGNPPVEVGESDNVATPGSGVWALANSDAEDTIEFTLALNEGSELAFKHIMAGDRMYFLMGVKSLGNLFALGGAQSYVNWYSNSSGLGDFDFTATENSFVIIKNVAGELKFYQTTDNDVSRTELVNSAPLDFTVDPVNVVSIKIYTYDGHPYSRIYYPQYKA